jgi:hypothetical protein
VRHVDRHGGQTRGPRAVARHAGAGRLSESEPARGGREDGDHTRGRDGAPSGHHRAVAGRNARGHRRARRRIRVWAPGAAAEPLRLGEYRQAIADLAFAPDGLTLASIGRHRESTLRLWQDDGAGGWKEVAAIPVGRCLALRFDAKGQRLAVMCEDEVLILEVATRQETRRLRRTWRRSPPSTSADGSRLTAGRAL